MAYLQVESPEGVRHAPLSHTRLSVGRLPANDIVIPFQQISRYHAELECVDGVWWIRDLRSTNGVRIDGQRVARCALPPGERVHLAPGISLTLVLTGSAQDPTLLPTTQMPIVGTRQSAPPPASVVSQAASSPPPPLPRFGPPERLGAPGPVVVGDLADLADDPQREIDGDLFRRRALRPSTPTAGPAPAIGGPPTSVALLHLCQTCGQLTAPDALYCQCCQNSIVQPCRSCGLSLLPIQDRCSRCHTPNPASVLRTRRGRPGESS